MFCIQAAAFMRAGVGRRETHPEAAIYCEKDKKADARMAASAFFAPAKEFICIKSFYARIKQKI